MADNLDNTKAQKIKLANSRKKFKELQELKKKRDVSENLQAVTAATADNPQISQTLAESLTNSSHSLDNDHTGEILLSTNLPNTESQLPNYFCSNNYGNLQQHEMFFDNLSNEAGDIFSIEQTSNTHEYLNSLSHETTYMPFGVKITDVIDTPNAEVPYDTNYSLFSPNNQPSFLAETQQIIHPHQDNISVDDVDIKQNEVFDKQAESNVSVQNRQDLIDYLQGNNNVIEVQECPAVNNDPINLNQAHLDGNHSSIESLKQLSNQMAQVIEPEYAQYSNSITDLEKRNLELAALLEQEKLKSDQQRVFINDLQSKIVQIESETNAQNEQSHLQLLNEISKLKEELQCHIQTVGLLVAEKTELSASLSQFEMTCKQKNSECEELQARLKTSRSRVADLEHEVNAFKAEKSMIENMEKKHSDMYLDFKKECSDLREQKEELVQDLLEAREKLKNSLEENLKFQHQLKDNSSKLSLAELKIQQISSGEQFAAGRQVESLMEEKFELQKQITSLSSMLKTMTKERDESSMQYQQYAQQLNAQMTNLSNRIEQLQRDNENLSVQDQNRIKHISELERQLQNLQNEQVAFATSRTVGDGNFKSDLDKTRELCIQLQVEKTAAEENLTKTLNEKEMLLKELSAKNDSLSQLEIMIEQLRGNQPDSVKLLATMESDKIAAARAVEQNKELKDQMESMQEVFMKLNNDKVELTEKLTMEQSGSKELLEKLQKVELQVQRLTDAIEIKDRELSSVREQTSELDKKFLQHEQLTDHLRHYEAQENSSRVLQFELQEAKQTIIKLINDINILKNESGNHITTSSDNLGLVENVNNEQVKGYDNHETSDVIYNKTEVIDTDNNNIFNGTLDGNSRLDNESAMKCLEEKFKSTMQKIADLTEEKQRLEHLVLQLQGETETIGEYVALYQNQRMVLKQKAIEKDQQLRQLANDREQMKSKLEKLNELIKRLVIEKGQIPTELLQQHKNLTSQSDNFCEEHSKLHREISKINDVSSVEVPTDEKSETAKEIIELLSEIKNSNLIQSKEDFHHCAWCSGKLIIV